MLRYNSLNLSALAFAIAVSTSAMAATAINIKSQPLATALTSLAKQSDIQIFARNSILKNLQAKAIYGEESVQLILSKLLLNTDLEAHWVSDTDVVIKKKLQKIEAKKLVKPTNNLVLVEQEIEKITVYGRHNRLVLSSGTATKSNMSLMETPAAIVVVDKLLLDEQATATLQDSLRNVSGLSQAGNNYGIGDNLQIRGLGANYTYDGMYGGAGLGSNSANPTRSTTNIESIEVLKGPATGLYGIGSAGGVINMVEKKPQDKEAYQVKATLGQWNNRGIMFDATSAINDTVAYRLVANSEKSDGYRGLSSARNELYGSLRFNLTNDQELIVSTAYIDDKNQVDSIGHPVRIFNLDSVAVAAADITWQDLPNDATWVAPTADKAGYFKGLQLTEEQRTVLANSIAATDGLKPYDLGSQGLISPVSRPNEGKEIRFKVNHTINFDINSSLRQQFQFRNYKSDFVRQTGAYNYVYWNRRGVTNANPRAPLVIDDVIYPFSARRQEYRRSKLDETSWQYFADFSTSWSLGDFEGEHLLSANYEKRKMAQKNWSVWDADRDGKMPYILDIRNPNWSDKSFEELEPFLKSNFDKSVTSYGVSFQEVVYFSDFVTGRFGLAHTKISQDYANKKNDYPSSEDRPLQDFSDSGIGYNVGLNYRITNDFATFVNFSKGRTASSILGGIYAENNQPDSESKSFDLGIRFTAFDEELLASFIYFETRKTNLRRGNPLFNDDIKDPEYNVDVPEYKYDNENNTKGYEFDLNLAINDQWTMNANATYQDAVEIRNQSKTPISGQRKGIPKKFASLWTSYSQEFSPLEQPIKFSVGVTYTGERTINSTAFGLPISTIDAYTVLDAGISYDVEAWNIQLNLRNLTDETYYSKALYIGGLPGDSRNAKLTVRYNF